MAEGRRGASILVNPGVVSLRAWCEWESGCVCAWERESMAEWIKIMMPHSNILELIKQYVNMLLLLLIKKRQEMSFLLLIQSGILDVMTSISKKYPKIRVRLP